MAELHGVRVTESALGAPPIDLPDVSNIGIVGTALGAGGKFLEGEEINYNHPFLITTRAQAVDLGTEGTLPDALDGIFAQTRARVVMVIVEGFEDGPAIADGVASGKYGGAATEFEVGEGTVTPANITFFDFKNSFAGLAQIAALKKGQVLTVEGRYLNNAATPVQATYDIGTFKVVSYTRNDTSVSGRNNLLAVRRLDVSSADGDFVERASDSATGGDGDITYHFTAASQDGTAKSRTEAIGNLAARTGVYALMSAQSVVGVTPNLILAPDLRTGEQVEGADNPLGRALETVAGRIRAIALIAGPNTNHSDATTVFADAYSDDRTYLIDPYVKISKGSDIVNRDPTPYFAGVIVKNDASRQAGWAYSPSNKLISGILGTARPIDYIEGNANSHAQLLNNAGIATIINLGGGYRTWGNETPASGDRAPWKFLNVRRTADVLYKAIQDEHLWAVDEGITPTYFEDVSEGVNAFIRGLISQRALIAGRCFPDQDLNTADNIALGRAYFNVEYTPIYPAQSVIFKVSLTTDALDSLV